MKDFINFLYTYYPNTEWSIKEENYDGLSWGGNNIINKPTKEEFENNFATFINSKPLRLLRLERNRLLQQSDWMANSDVVMTDEWRVYRQALRDLPQQIEAGEITAPTLNDNGMLVFEHWPERIY